MSHRKIKGSWHSFSLSKWKVHFLHISSLLDLAIFHNKFNFFHSGEFAVILFSIQFNLKYAFYQINPTSLQILRPTRWIRQQHSSYFELVIFSQKDQRERHHPILYPSCSKKSQYSLLWKWAEERFGIYCIGLFPLWSNRAQKKRIKVWQGGGGCNNSHNGEKSNDYRYIMASIKWRRN